MRKSLSWLGVALLPVVVLGGIEALKRDTAIRAVEWPPDMTRSPAYLSQTANPVLALGMTQQAPVPGTIPRGYEPFRYGPGPEEAARAGRELVNPFEPTRQNLARGRRVFSSFCSVCHGETGAGDGPIVPKFPNPPSFHTEASRALKEGTMFHIITLGRKNMPSYAAQVPAEDRWKVILHIRSLQGK